MELSHPRGFGSDNHATIHPEILKAIADFNTGHAPAYGTDALTLATKELIRSLFGNSECFFVFNGTAANVLCLRALLKPHEAVITTETSHLAVDECGAPEFHGANKIITVKTTDGKLRPEDIRPLLVRRGDQHAVQPRLASITQPTELGTVYSLDELRALREVTRANELLLHVDGARLANAVLHLNTDFRTMTAELGIDALSLGGTKNGLMGGEAVLLFHPGAAADFKYIQKQEMQLPSKTRFIAAQFYAYFTGDLWRRIAAHSCGLAKKLAAALEGIPEIEITQPVQSNAVFPRIPKPWTKSLKDTCFFYVWDETDWTVRLMLSHDNTEADIASFRAAVDRLRATPT